MAPCLSLFSPLFAMRRPGVRIPSRPPYFKKNDLERAKRSSALACPSFRRPASFSLPYPLLFLLPAAVCLVALSKILRYWPAHDPKRPSQINAGRTARLGLGQAHDASCKRFPNIRPSAGEDLRQKTGAGSAPWLLGARKAPGKMFLNPCCLSSSRNLEKKKKRKLRRCSKRQRNPNSAGGLTND